MANVITTSLALAEAAEVLVQAYKKVDTINKIMITVLPNVVGTAVLPRVSYAAAQTAYTCGFTPIGGLTYIDRVITPKKFKVDEEICKDEFASTVQAYQAGIFESDGPIPEDILSAILDAMTSSLGAIIEDQIWNGANGANDFFGLLPQWLADAAVIDIDFPAALTKANVVAAIEQVYDAIPAALYGEPDVVMGVSYNVAKLYSEAQASMGNNTTVGMKDLNFAGIRMESLGGLPTDTVVAYRVKNVVFATGLNNEWNQVRVSDDEDRLDGNIRTKIAYTGAVGYSFGAEIVWGRVIP